MGATTADLLWSIGVFVGVPALLFAVLVWRELRRHVKARRAAQADAKAMRQEGYPPGPPVASSSDEP